MRSLPLLLTLALSGPFLLWMTLSSAAILFRCWQMIPQYSRWSMMPDREQNSLVLIPGIFCISEWADFQRMNAVIHLLHGDWQAATITWVTAVQLLIGTVGSCAVLWVILRMLFGITRGRACWINCLILGALMSIMLLVW